MATTDFADERGFRVAFFLKRTCCRDKGKESSRSLRDDNKKDSDNCKSNCKAKINREVRRVRLEWSLRQG